MILVQTLKEQMSEMQNSASLNDSGYAKKEIERFKKDKMEFEEKARKEKIKSQLDVEKLKKDIQILELQRQEQIKHHEKDFSIKLDEIAKEKQKYAKLEADMLFLQSETQKKMAELQKKKQNGEYEASQKEQIADKKITDHYKIVSELDACKLKVEEMQIQYDGLLAEFEVQKASNDRFMKTISEKEEIIKKLKTRGEEVLYNDRLTKKAMEKLEKEMSSLKIEMVMIQSTSVAVENELSTKLEHLKIALSSSEDKSKELEHNLGKLTSLKETLEEKLLVTETVAQNTEKKNAQLVHI
jgi:hypothetical protein